MPARKKAAGTAGKKTAKRKGPSRARKATTARRRLVGTVAVGDAVKLPADVRNRFSGYDPRLVAQAGRVEAIEGIVCSIREIATGKLVAKTTGDLTRYVLEVVHSQTFRPHYASDKNTAGLRGTEDVRGGAAWQRFREMVREMAARKELAGLGADSASDSPLRSLLDGWRVVKVRAEQVEALQ